MEQLPPRLLPHLSYHLHFNSQNAAAGLKGIPMPWCIPGAIMPAGIPIGPDGMTVGIIGGKAAPLGLPMLRSTWSKPGVVGGAMPGGHGGAIRPVVNDKVREGGGGMRVLRWCSHALRAVPALPCNAYEDEDEDEDEDV